MKAHLDDQKVIVRAVERAFRSSVVILCGSRATGEPGEGSDYDLFVVLPLLRTLSALRRLRGIRRELEHQLRAPVSLNPLPLFRLRYPGRSLLVWKIRREGIVLNAPPGFRLAKPAVAQVPTAARYSYAVSALMYLIEDVDPTILSIGPLSETVAHDVRKALLHAAQLHLLSQGRYAPTLEESLPALNGDFRRELTRLAESSTAPDTWFRVRDLLLRQLANEKDDEGLTLLRNAQYVALRVLQRRDLKVTALLQNVSVATALSRATILLARSLTHDGVATGYLSAAMTSLPAFLRPSVASWTSVRDVVKSEWHEANPLLGF